MTQEDESKRGIIITQGQTGDRIRSAASWIMIAVLLLLWLLGFVYGTVGRWIHLLLALAAVAIAAQFATKGWASKDIEPDGRFIPIWDPAEPAKSLAEIHSYVIGEANKSVGWYWGAKRSQARFSQIIRFLAWILAAAGGLLPVFGYVFQKLCPNYPPVE